MAADQNRCPAPGVLEGLLAERLSGAERDRVQTHVEACTACQVQLARLTADTLCAAARPTPPGAGRAPAVV